MVCMNRFEGSVGIGLCMDENDNQPSSHSEQVWLLHSLQLHCSAAALADSA